MRGDRPSGGARGAWTVPPTSGTSVGPSTADSRARTPTLTPRCSGVRPKMSACRTARSSRSLSFDISRESVKTLQASPRRLHGDHVVGRRRHRGRLSLPQMSGPARIGSGPAAIGNGPAAILKKTRTSKLGIYLPHLERDNNNQNKTQVVKGLVWFPRHWDLVVVL